jgi:hypothetical protein
MEIIDPEKKVQETPNEPRPEKRRFILTGLLLLVFGGLLIADRAGNQFPDWFISWETILIVVGVYIGEKHRFRNLSFLVPIAIGVIFLVNDYYPDLSIKYYVGPVILILVGMGLILRPRRIRNFRDYHRRMHRDYAKEYYTDTTPGMNSGEDYLDNVSIFGGTKKNIMSKNFKGGEATCFFGGLEINLMQADIQGQIELDLTQIFGGCKLIVPSHWEIKSELVNIFGGVEDKRPTQNINTDHSKVILLRGTSIFGGIEIRSY